MKSSKSPLRPPAALFAAIGFTVISFAAVVAYAEPVPAPNYEWHTVKEVVSGDTCRLDTGTLVAYSSIAAPPLKHMDPKIREYGQKSLDFNREMLMGKKIRVEFGSQIRNEDGVYQGFVYLEDGTFANLKMVEAGYAKLKILPPNLQHAKELRYASRHARHDGSGLWEFENKVARRFVYVADKMTKKFHFSGCRLLRGVSKAHTRRFEASVDAKAAGYEFCAECRHVYAQETDLF